MEHVRLEKLIVAEYTIRPILFMELSFRRLRSSGILCSLAGAAVSDIEEDLLPSSSGSNFLTN
jgi:hypothetical protein